MDPHRAAVLLATGEIFGLIFFDICDIIKLENCKLLELVDDIPDLFLLFLVDLDLKKNPFIPFFIFVSKQDLGSGWLKNTSKKVKFWLLVIVSDSIASRRKQFSTVKVSILFLYFLDKFISVP